MTIDYAPPNLPLVSVIITAFNYGRYLKEAIASVRAQTYRDIECLVVNDASTDDTVAILEEIQACDPGLQVLTLPENRGQGGASRAGFKASRGQYVVFMDADDVLAPDFVLTHVYVHLSSRTHFGLTSSDIWQTFDNRVVVSTYKSLNEYILANPPAGAGAFRPIDRHAREPWTYAGPDASVLDGVRIVPPARVGWCWSPMTSNMFRRDALTLIIDCEQFESLRLSTDAYLCTGVSVLCGSLLIDQALSAYRIHGANSGTFEVQLQNLRPMWPAAEQSQRAKSLLLEHFISARETLLSRFWAPGPLRVAIEKLQADLSKPAPAPAAVPAIAGNGAGAAQIAAPAHAAS